MMQEGEGEAQRRMMIVNRERLGKLMRRVSEQEVEARSAVDQI